MANFIRFGAIRAFNNHFITTISTKSPSSLLPYSQTRCIKTSSKPIQASHDGNGSTTVNRIETHKGTDEEKSKNWVSWGASEEDEWWDRCMIHSTFFMAISVCIVGCGTFMAYHPDSKQHEWIAREAFIRLRYREENGLPLVSPNLVDPAKITLPTDEELGDTEIII